MLVQICYPPSSIGISSAPTELLTVAIQKFAECIHSQLQYGIGLYFDVKNIF